MGLKDAILQVMDRDALKCVVNDFELSGADRRSVASMRECVAQSHVATPESLLGYLYETRVKDVCALLGIDRTGRRGALVQMLLDLPSGSSSDAGNPVTPERSTSQLEAESAAAGQGPRQSGANSRSRKANEKAITRYGYTDLKEPRTPETGHTPLLPGEEQSVSLRMDNGWSRALEVGRLPDQDERPVVVDMDPSVDPVLLWAGKRNRREVPVLPLQRNEIISESRIAQIVERARRAAESETPVDRQQHLFAELDKELREEERHRRVDFYTHDEGWKNKLKQRGGVSSYASRVMNQYQSYTRYK